MIVRVLTNFPVKLQNIRWEFFLECGAKIVNVGWDHLSNVTYLVNIEFPEKVTIDLVEDIGNNYDAL